jgi:hypothetical protein
MTMSTLSVDCYRLLQNTQKARDSASISKILGEKFD